MLKNKSIIFYIFLALLVWYLFAFAVYPSLITLTSSLTKNGNFGFDNYKQIFQSPNLSAAFFNTLLLSFSTVIICGIVGCSLSLCIHAVQIPFRRIFHIIVLLPMVIPGTVVVVAYVFLYGVRGFIGWPLRELLGLPLNSYSIEGFGGVLLIHAFTQYIYFYLLTTEAIERINVSQIEAAKSLGVGKFRTFFQIVFPSFGPHITGAAVLTFLSASGSFSAPMIIGGNFRVMSTEIYFSKQAGYINLAATQAVLLSLIIIIVISIIRYYELKCFSGKDFKGSLIPFTPIKNKTISKIATVYVTILSVIIILPIIAVILISFGKPGRWASVFHDQYTLENYINVFKNARNIQPIYNSIIIAFMATIISAFIGIFASYVITRTKIKGRTLLESICMLPWILPPSTILIALIASYNVPNILVLNITFIGTYWFMPLAFIILRLPVMVRNSSASLISLPKSIEEASKSLGANGLVTFFKVILPMMLTGISFSLIITFIFIMGDYGVPTFASVANNRPITTAIVNAIGSQRIELGMVYGSCLIVISIVFIGLFSLFTIKNKKY